MKTLVCVFPFLCLLAFVAAAEDTSDPVVEALGDAFCRSYHPDMDTKECKSVASLVVYMDNAAEMGDYCPGVHYNSEAGNKVLSAAVARLGIHDVLMIRDGEHDWRDYHLDREQRSELCAPRIRTLRAFHGLLSFDWEKK